MHAKYLPSLLKCDIFRADKIEEDTSQNLKTHNIRRYIVSQPSVIVDALPQLPPQYYLRHPKEKGKGTWKTNQKRNSVAKHQAKASR